MTSIPLVANATSMPATNQNAAPGSAVFPPMRAIVSLYVGDLHPDATESNLYEKFSTIGPLTSIRVCRDAITRRSLGYAYVNYQNPADAEKAIDSLNFENVMGKPIRIMWSQRDPSLRRSGAGNIFIKNLDKRIDAKSLHDTFSLFGSILSCKVALDEHGVSRGYGFIQFESEDSAQKAISKVDGMLLDNKKVFACKFQPRSERFNVNGASSHFRNVYVKNFGDLWDSEKFESVFSKFGKITSCTVITDANGKPKGFGFVAFEKPESAEKAVEEMNGIEVVPGSDRKLTVCRAQTKVERLKELKKKFDSTLQKCHLGNLYVKQLDESFDDDQLRETFEKFGKINSAKIMRDETGRSKGFGFVCFENPEDANKAQAEMHGKFLVNKPIYVAHAQRKDERRSILASHYMQRLAKVRMQTGQPANGGGSFPGSMYTPVSGGYFMAPTGIPNPRTQGLYPTYTSMLPTWNLAAGNVQMPLLQGGMYAANQTRTGPRHVFTNQGGKRYDPNYRQGGRGVHRPYQHPRMGKPPQQQQQQSAQGLPNVSSEQAQMEQKMANLDINIQALSSQLSAQASVQDQKQLIGEQLFKCVAKFSPEELVGKVTGMILEMEIAELLVLLENTDSLKVKVEEALDVLKKHGNL
uniref:Polyadenylate-binding protein n=1 Tax=Acrobeloides nanus TaxID=290746 RepID=A0A914E7T3_9BILA